MPGFLVAQVLGATAATATFAWLLPVRRGAEPVPLRDELEKPEREVA